MAHNGDWGYHDLSVSGRQGDGICFVVTREADGERTDVSGDKVAWDPVITFVRGDPPVWKPNPPGQQNLALGKYARSKRLWHAFRPFDAVDGSPETFFALSNIDKMASGQDDWLMVDLDKPYVIDRYVVRSEPKNGSWRPRDFTLQRSDDGLFWTDVETVRGNINPRTERGVTPFKARFVRLYLPDGRPFCINEFELYRTDGKPCPTN